MVSVTAPIQCTTAFLLQTRGKESVQVMTTVETVTQGKLCPAVRQDAVLTVSVQSGCVLLLKERLIQIKPNNENV